MTVVNLKEFAEKNGLPYDDTGVIDMTETVRRAVEYCQTNALGPVYLDPGVFLTHGTTAASLRKDIKRKRYQRRYVRLARAK